MGREARIRRSTLTSTAAHKTCSVCVIRWSGRHNTIPPIILLCTPERDPQWASASLYSLYATGLSSLYFISYCSGVLAFVLEWIHLIISVLWCRDAGMVFCQRKRFLLAFSSHIHSEHITYCGCGLAFFPKLCMPNKSCFSPYRTQ